MLSKRGRSCPVVAVDRGRIAILRPDAAVDIRNAHGRLLHSVGVPPGPVTNGVELNGERLVVLLAETHAAGRPPTAC